MEHLCEISVSCSDIVDFVCDVVVLKYAEEFYGADWLIASRISDDPAQDISPWPGYHLSCPQREEYLQSRYCLWAYRHSMS